MNTNRIDSPIYDDKDYDSDHLSWAQQSGDSTAGFNNSDSSHSSDHSSSSSSSSSDCESDHSDSESEDGFFAIGFAGLRRRLSKTKQQDADSQCNDNCKSEETADSKYTRRKRPGSGMLFLNRYHERYSAATISSMALISCFVIWLFVKVLSINTGLDKRMAVSQNGHLAPEQKYRLRKQQREDAERALGSAAVISPKKIRHSGWSTNHEGSRKTKVSNSKESLSLGCVPSDWHKLSFPNCNLLHEIDLGEIILGNTHKTSVHVGSGLWRDVFKVTDNVGAVGVLKIMKGEHEVDSRNFDRHRRDALVMERLAASPYIVSMFGFCGNSVLTEFVGKGLDIVLHDNSTNFPSRNSPMHRLKLSIDIAKSIEVLHGIDGGPIVHTDLQSEQFLVDETGRVKLNDFNRCRFVAHKNKTGEACPFRIPTAPGEYRSPEEYEDLELSNKLDIYSTANVLYEVLTGYEPWPKTTVTKVKVHVTKGDKPPIPDEYLYPGSTDAGLAQLINLGYEFSPDHRISAADMVVGLEKLLLEAN